MQMQSAAATSLKKSNLVCQDQRVPTFPDLDRRRKLLGVSVDTLLAEARVNRAAWFDGKRGLVSTRVGTFTKLGEALDRLAAKRRLTPPPSLIAAFVYCAEDLLRRRITEPALIAAFNPKRAPRSRVPEALPARRVRTLALYLVTVELQIENAEVARAVGCARQNIKQQRGVVEDLRENEQVDAVLSEIAARLRGEPA